MNLEKAKQKLPKEKQIIEIEPISNKEKEFDNAKYGFLISLQ